jgi:hypothetical protein
MSGTAAFHAKPRFSSKASLYVNAPASVMAAEVTLQRTTGRPAEVPTGLLSVKRTQCPRGPPNLVLIVFKPTPKHRRELAITENPKPAANPGFPGTGRGFGSTTVSKDDVRGREVRARLLNGSGKPFKGHPGNQESALTSKSALTHRSTARPNEATQVGKAGKKRGVPGDTSGL